MLPYGSYFCDHTSVYNLLLDQLDGVDYIYTNLETYLNPDRTTYFNWNLDSTQKMMTTLYNELHTETYQFLETKLEELKTEFPPETAPQNFASAVADWMVVGEAGISFDLAEVRPKIETKQVFLLLCNFHPFYLKKPGFKQLFVELVSNAATYQIYCLVATPSPFNSLPSQLVAGFDHLIFTHLIPTPILEEYFDFDDPTIDDGVSRMISGDHLILSRAETDYDFFLLPDRRPSDEFVCRQLVM